MPAAPPKVLFQAAIRDWPLRDVVKLCGWSLSTYMGNGGVAWPSTAAVAAGAGCHERTAQRALRELEELGWLQVRHSPGRAPNVYHVNPGAIAPGLKDGQPRQAGPSTPAELCPPTPAELCHPKGLEGKNKDARARDLPANGAEAAAAFRELQAKGQRS